MDNVKNENKFHQMTEAPVHKLIVSLAIPTIFSMLITSFYNTADTFFVSKINTSATAAVGVTFACMAIIQALGFFFGHGSGNYVSRKLGAQEFNDANIMASTGFFLAFITGVILAIPTEFFLTEIVTALGSTPTIVPYAKDYLRIIIIGAPIMMSSLVMNNQLRFQGSAAYGMVGIVSGGLLNVILDPIFIFTFDLGIAGAAYATVLSQCISLIILLFMSTKGGNIVIHWRNFHPSGFLLKEIFAGGSPSLFRQGFSSISTIVLNVAAGVYGDAAIAGMSIVTRLIFLSGSAMIGFGQGFQPVCGFNYGAKLYSRVREGYYFSLKTITIFTFCVALLGSVFAREIISLFRNDPEVIRIGVWALHYQLLLFPLSGLVVLTNMTLQTTRYTKGAILVAASRQGLFLIPALLILPRFFGLAGVIWSQPCSDCLSIIMSFYFIRLFMRDLKKKEKNLELTLQRS
jgi:putative MATE family efflux protein